MDKNRLKAKIGLLFSAFLITFSFQSCNKESDVAAPDAASISQNASGVTSGAGITPIAPCETVCLVAGQTMRTGTVEAAIEAGTGDLLVTYKVAQMGVSILEVHMDVFATLGDLTAAKKLSNGGAIPGKFRYKSSYTLASNTRTVQVRVDKNELPAGNCFFIASHAALSNGETAWGQLCDEVPTRGGLKLNTATTFPGSNWGTFFNFCRDACTAPISYTYAWEDLKNTFNDADYNDLVVQSIFTRQQNNELKVNFLASARGADYDHQFKFKIPMTGITGVYGASEVTDDGTYYYVTVFPSTKAALPASPQTPGGLYPFAANTSPNQTVDTPTASKLITLTVNNQFMMNTNKPIEPYITVLPNVGDPTPYDLYVYSVSGRDYWSNPNINGGNPYPNGIIIPSDWRWPLETQIITGPYPAFGFALPGGITNTAWPTTNVNLALTFDRKL